MATPNKQPAPPAVQIIKPGQAPAEKAPAAPKEVKGKSQKLVAVHYKKANTHILHHVHAITQGVNHLPEEVLAEALKHPANAALVASGDLVILKDAKEVAKASKEDEAKKAAEADAAAKVVDGDAKPASDQPPVVDPAPAVDEAKK